MGQSLAQRAASYPMSKDVEDRTQAGIGGAIRRYASIADTLVKQGRSEYNDGAERRRRESSPPARTASRQAASMPAKRTASARKRKSGGRRASGR